MPKRTRLTPRKDPHQQRAVATVAAILEAAARILETKGLDGLTTNHVATAAGVSVGSLYQYFPNKDAIVAALIREAHEALRDDVVAVANVDGSFADRVTALVEVAVRHQFARPTLARILDVEEARLPVEPLTRAAVAEMHAALNAAFADRVPARSRAIVIADVMAIARGMIDAAGQRGEHDTAALCARVSAAVLGYLKESGVLVRRR